MEAVSGATPDGGQSHQQVVSAQEAQPTAHLNGTTGPQSSGRGYGATVEVAPRAVGTTAGREPPVVTEGVTAPGCSGGLGFSTAHSDGGQPPQPRRFRWRRRGPQRFLTWVADLEWE